MPFPFGLMLWHLLFYVWTASEILIAILTRTKRGSGGRVQDRGSMLILWLVILASVTASEWIGDISQPAMAPTLKTVALVVMIVGLAIRWTSVFSLGQAFSANVAIRENQKLKTAGPYHWVRHPSYFGLLLIFIAIGLHTRNWLALACATIPTTAALLYRIRVEEEALNLAFGDEYATYCHRTKRLIPGIL